MKLIKYYLSAQENHGTDEHPELVTVQGAACQIKSPDIVYKENLAMAQAEAFNGEITVEDVPDDRPLDEIKSDQIAKSKTMLAAYLAAHPLTWTDGKQYNVTENKQTLLTGNIAAYQLAVTLGQTAELTWNATGEECTIWTFENLAALVIAIKAYVKPFVAYQQSAEVAINACTTVDAVMSVPLDYENV